MKALYPFLFLSHSSSYLRIYLSFSSFLCLTIFFLPLLRIIVRTIPRSCYHERALPPGDIVRENFLLPKKRTMQGKLMWCTNMFLATQEVKYGGDTAMYLLSCSYRNTCMNRYLHTVHVVCVCVDFCRFVKSYRKFAQPQTRCLMIFS